MSDEHESCGQAPVRQVTLIYDANCRLCVTAKRGIQKLGRDRPTTDIRFLPYQSEEAARHLGTDYVAGRPEIAFLVRGGELRKGLDAFLPLLPGIRGGAFISSLLQIPWLRPTAYWLYRIVARYRYQLFGQVPASKTEEPSPEPNRPA